MCGLHLADARYVLQASSSLVLTASFLAAPIAPMTARITTCTPLPSLLPAACFLHHSLVTLLAVMFLHLCPRLWAPLSRVTQQRIIIHFLLRPQRLPPRAPYSPMRGIRTQIVNTVAAAANIATTTQLMHYSNPSREFRI
jgi:hypothetical protein